MIYVRDGLSFSNENSTLGDALLRWFSSRRRGRKRAAASDRLDNAKSSKSRTRRD